MSLFSSLAPYLEPARGDCELARCGDYSLIRQIGAGGMGVVYLAIRDGEVAPSTALKIARADIHELEKGRNSKLLERSTREILSHSKLDSRYVVKYMGGGETPRKVDGVALPWLATAFIKGRSLRDKIDVWGRLPQVEVARLGLQICLGLAHIHQFILHRDIKPSNILLDIVNAERAMIVDFGVARPLTGTPSQLTQGSLLGTVNYIAPELWDAPERFSFASDLFSVGCVLYEALVGQLPFGVGLMDSKRDIYRHPCDVIPHLNRGLADMVWQLLEKDPDARLRGYNPATAARDIAVQFCALSKCLAGMQELPSERWPVVTKHAVREALEHLAQDSYKFPEGRASGILGQLLGLSAQKLIAERLRVGLEETANGFYMFAQANTPLTNTIDVEQAEAAASELQAKLTATLSDLKPNEQFPRFKALLADVHACKQELENVLSDLQKTRLKLPGCKTGPSIVASMSSLSPRILDLEKRVIELVAFVGDLLEAAIASGELPSKLAVGRTVGKSSVPAPHLPITQAAQVP